MVYKIINNRYRPIIESFILAVVIFLIGFSIGFYIENSRLTQVTDQYNANEIQALDLKLQDYYYQIMSSSSCQTAIEQNFIFADNLYNQGLELEKYEDASKISDSLKVEKERYVLLKTELWLNSILLKQKCKNPFDTVVYFYINNPGAQEDAEQQVISNILQTVKKEKGDTFVLLPIAGDMGLGAVDLQMRNYNITSLPAVLINEKTVLYGFHTPEDIEKYLK
jgi:hypothetical protein